MSTYKTTIPNKEAKWNQLKAQLDNFSTFTWRGQRADEKFHMFIISEKQGDLKFYNGPSFSNEYSKAQFNTASGNLLGVTFNRQQIGFKVGMYYFSISDWQDFIEWINPYEINYLSFSHAPKYGYMVKLAKMEDSPRYVVGNENSEPMYYTEMILTWDLQGDSCVRANLPYEWKLEGIPETDSFYNQYDYKQKLSCDEAHLECSKISRLETPLVLNIPVEIKTKNPADMLAYSMGYKHQWVMGGLQDSIDYLCIDEQLNIVSKDSTNYYNCYTKLSYIGHTIEITPLKITFGYRWGVSDLTELFNCSVSPWAYGNDVVTAIRFDFNTKANYKYINQPSSSGFEYDLYIYNPSTQNYDKNECKGFSFIKDTNTIEFQVNKTSEGSGTITDFYLIAHEILPSALYPYIENQYDVQLNTDSFYKQNFFSQYITIQYDSETGTLLYKAGDNNWKLLHLTLTDSNGGYMVQNMVANKFKLQGDISKYQFELLIKNGQVPSGTKPTLQIYERTNVI